MKRVGEHWWEKAEFTGSIILSIAFTSHLKLVIWKSVTDGGTIISSLLNQPAIPLNALDFWSFHRECIFLGVYTVNIEYRTHTLLSSQIHPAQILHLSLHHILTTYFQYSVFSQYIFKGTSLLKHLALFLAYLL